MEKGKQTTTVLKVIGIISILSAAFSAFIGQPFENYFYGLLFGAILLGSGYINHTETRQEENQN